LGDQLDDDQDAFNQDTFGGGDAVGKDFDYFSKTAQISDVINEEQVRYNLQHTKPSVPLATGSDPHTSSSLATQKPKKSGYEKYKEPGFIPEIQAKSSVWGTTTQKVKLTAEAAALTTSPPAAPPAALPVVPPVVPPPVAPPPVAPPVVPAAAPSGAPSAVPTRKMLSLEEVEAQIRAQSQRPVHIEPVVSPPPPVSEVTRPTHSPQQVPTISSVPESHNQPPQELLYLEQHTRFGRGIPPPQVLQRPPRAPPEIYHSPPIAPSQVPLQVLQKPNRAPPQQRYPGPSAQRQPQQPQQPQVRSQGLPAAPSSQPLVNLTEEQRAAYMAEDAKRAKRNHKIFLLSKGNGLMTPQDKNFITRIQLQQLVAATGNITEPDPESVLSEDFYYQVYSQIRGAPRQHPRQPLGHFAQTYLFQTGRGTGSHGSRRQFQSADNHMQRMQQQVQRAVEAAKLKPKNKQLIIEGSLGKISFSNAKTPKPLLNIKRPESSDGIKSTKRIANTELSPSDRKSILTNIESVYGTLMKMEDMERAVPPPEEHDLDALPRHVEWRQRMQSLNQKLWYELKVLEPIVPGSTIPHPFIALLSYPKGKKAIPRIFRQIDQEQRVTILTIIVVHLDALDVVRRGQLQPGENQPPVAVREEIELFSQTVMPSLLGYVNEAPFNIIIGLLGLVLAQTHVQSVARTKVGLGILTMLLSRAEIVKDAEQADERDWLQWCEKFDILFDSLEPILGNIFPKSINSGDDIYAWQFLAAVGIGANPEQQQRLVIAVK
jgi:DNA topoisomerase 2-associated protein PAT1